MLCHWHLEPTFAYIFCKGTLYILEKSHSSSFKALNFTDYSLENIILSEIGICHDHTAILKVICGNKATTENAFLFTKYIFQVHCMFIYDFWKAHKLKPMQINYLSLTAAALKECGSILSLQTR